MGDMDWMVIEVQDLVDQHTATVDEAIDAVVMMNDLDAGEKRMLIHLVHVQNMRAQA